MFVEKRTDLTEEEWRKAAKPNGYKYWPWKDTGEFVYARRMTNAKAFYRALRKIDPIIKIKARYVSGREPKHGSSDVVAMRAWRGFVFIKGTVGGAADEVRHCQVDIAGHGGETVCGIRFSEWWPSFGKPECPECLAAAIVRHPEMKQYL